MITTVQCTCLQCGVSFSIRKILFDTGQGKYCSKKCSGIAHSKQIECRCITCGNTFYVKQSRFNDGKGKYCSRTCRDLNPSVMRYCLICGKRLITSQKKYCSKSCEGVSNRGASNRRWRGGGKTYRGPNWTQQRNLAYSRDGGVCQHCGNSPKQGERKYDVHHIKPFNFCPNYEEANQLINLVVLCRKCHGLAENGVIQIQPKLF